MKWFIESLLWAQKLFCVVYIQLWPIQDPYHQGTWLQGCFSLLCGWVLFFYTSFRSQYQFYQCVESLSLCCVYVVRNAFTEQRYLVAAVPRGLLLMQWFQPHQIFKHVMVQLAVCTAWINCAVWMSICTNTQFSCSWVVLTFQIVDKLYCISLSLFWLCFTHLSTLSASYPSPSPAWRPLLMIWRSIPQFAMEWRLCK